ncbi:MAG: holo-ACP synthase [Enterocloster sp.]
MILGVGTDLVEIERIRRACEKDYFVMHTFTEKESRQAKGSASRLAGSFAVKEAVAKALGTGFRTFMPIDIEVLRDDLGKPYVNLYGGARQRFEEMGMERLEVSITNTGEYAMAFAVGEGRGKEES